MNSLIETAAISSRELAKVERILDNPESPARDVSDAQRGKLFWADRLRTAQMPLDALDVAYAAHHYFRQYEAKRSEISAVKELMSTTDPSHPAYRDMRRGNTAREAAADHFYKLFGERVLEAAELFPPVLETAGPASMSSADSEVDSSNLQEFESEFATVSVPSIVEPNQSKSPAYNLIH